jgi:hypothetical protein
LQNSNNSYNIDYAIEVCEEKALTSAIIYLYERRGDYKKAFTLAMEKLRDSPESLAEAQALNLCSLCVRISNVVVSEVERESYWFEVIETVLSRDNLCNIVKHVLHLSSSYVDLTKLVQLIMRNDGGTEKKFGDIKHILIGMLTNFEYESLLLSTTQSILGRDLHTKMVKEKQSAGAGVYCKYLKCFICQRKLSDSLLKSSESTNNDNDQIIIFSTCAHSVHQLCYEKRREEEKSSTDEDRNNEEDDKNLNSIKCHQCGLILHETDSVYLNKLNWNLISIGDDDVTHELNVKAPRRLGFNLL